MIELPDTLPQQLLEKDLSEWVLLGKDLEMFLYRDPESTFALLLSRYPRVFRAHRYEMRVCYNGSSIRKYDGEPVQRLYEHVAQRTFETLEDRARHDAAKALERLLSPTAAGPARS